VLRIFRWSGLDREQQATHIWVLAPTSVKRCRQNRHGQSSATSKSRGDLCESSTRGYMTRAEMRFIPMPAIYVGLLCLHTAKAGGASRGCQFGVSHNCMLAQRRTRKELCQDFYRSPPGGEFNPGEEPWIKHPIFCFAEGYFSAIGLGAAIEKAQKLPGVPPFTDAQKEAVALYRATVESSAVDMDFQPGDIQFLTIL